MLRPDQCGPASGARVSQRRDVAWGGQGRVAGCFQLPEKSPLTSGHQVGAGSVPSLSHKSSPATSSTAPLLHSSSVSLSPWASHPCLQPCYPTPTSPTAPPPSQPCSHPSLSCLGSISHQYPALRRNTHSLCTLDSPRIALPALPLTSGMLPPSSGPCCSSSRRCYPSALCLTGHS